MDIEELMSMTKEREASDLILTAGSPPILRIDKRIVFTKLSALSPGQIDKLLEPLMDEDKKARFKKSSEVSFIYSMSGWGRFRVTVFKQRGSAAIAIRKFCYNLPAIEELNLPAPPLEYCRGLTKGLVLVTGPVGGGKSTTLACVIRMKNNNDALHIITLENPIEYLFEHGKSVIEQREIPYDSPSFSVALQDVFRQSPDVVVVGEIHDQATMRETLRVAESGILVLATFHTSTAADTINSVINFFPKEEVQIRFQLSLVLRGVFSQQLIPVYQKQGVIPAWEWLVVTESVSSIIREGNIQQIDNVIETGAKFGMQSMDQSLMNLYTRKLISKNDLFLRLRYKERAAEVQKQEPLLEGDEIGPAKEPDTYHPNF
ncbi:MAG: PilT/PilU family type 4a pilus ATPase [Candidatus Omnitrophota bacterium]